MDMLVDVIACIRYRLAVRKNLGVSGLISGSP